MVSRFASGDDSHSGLTTIRIRRSDVNRVRNECKKIFLKYHPEAQEFTLSDSRMMHYLIHFYITNDSQEDHDY